MAPSTHCSSTPRTRSVSNRVDQAEALEKKKEQLRREELAQISHYSEFVRSQNRQKYREIDQELAQHRRKKDPQFDAQEFSDDWGSDASDIDDGMETIEGGLRGSDDRSNAQKGSPQVPDYHVEEMEGTAACSNCVYDGIRCFRGVLPVGQASGETGVTVGDTTFGGCRTGLVRRIQCRPDVPKKSTSGNRQKVASASTAGKRKRVGGSGCKAEVEEEISTKTRSAKKARTVNVAPEGPSEASTSKQAKGNQFSEQVGSQLDQFSKALATLITEVGKLEERRM